VDLTGRGAHSLESRNVLTSQTSDSEPHGDMEHVSMIRIPLKLYRFTVWGTMDGEIKPSGRLICMELEKKRNHAVADTSYRKTYGYISFNLYMDCMVIAHTYNIMYDIVPYVLSSSSTSRPMLAAARRWCRVSCWVLQNRSRRLLFGRVTHHATLSSLGARYASSFAWRYGPPAQGPCFLICSTRVVF
jgi:hypothetical protein